MRKSSFIKLVKVFLIGMFLLPLLACSPVKSTPALDPTEGVKLLTGEYTTKITTDDVAKLNSLDPNLSNNIGSWIISLKSDGTATAIYENRETMDINYTIDGNDMEIYIRNGNCSENIGRYKWELKGNELFFSKVADSCDSEVLVLTSHPLKRANP